MHTADDLPCRELVELVTEYLENALSPELRARFEAHLDVCSGCRLYVGQMRLTVHALRGHGHQPLPDALRLRLLARFRESHA